jgi:methyl-accepting chemotaxis protein
MKESKNANISRFGGIGGKILLIFISVIVAGIGALAFVGVNRASAALKKQAFYELEAVMTLKKNQFTAYWNTVKMEAEVISHSEDAHIALKNFVRYHVEMGIKADAAYDISSSKSGLTRTYEQIYGEVNKNLRVYTEKAGYYDLLFICYPHGHVMYSNAKEADLGTNLVTGKYKDSVLAEAWKKARETDDTVIVDMKPYAASNNEPAMFIARKVREDDGEILGIVAIQVSLKQINEIMQERTGMGKTGETYLVGPDKLMRSDSFLDPENRSVQTSLRGTIARNGVDTEASRSALAGNRGLRVITDYNGNSVLSSWDTIDLGDVKWAIIAEIDMAEINEPVNELTLFIVFIALGIIAVAVVVALIFSRSIAKPLGDATRLARLISEGDLTHTVQLDRGDEVGVLSRAMSTASENLRDMFSRIASGVQTLASQATELAVISKQMSGSAESTSRRSNTAAAAAEEMSSNMNSVSAAMEETATNIVTVATAAEEMTATISEIAGNSEKARAITKEAVEKAKEVTATMDELGKAAREIGKVTETISAISSQTNLLALNATIEAARAGQAGKGFAVVANEIKELAKQTAAATEDIKTRIDGIQGSTTGAVDSISKVAKVIAEVNEIVGGIAASIEEQSAVTKDIANNVSQASSAVEDTNRNVSQASSASTSIAQDISEVNQAANEIATSSSQVLISSEELSKLSEQLRGIVEQFKV